MKVKWFDSRYATAVLRVYMKVHKLSSINVLEWQLRCSK